MFKPKFQPSLCLQPVAQHLHGAQPHPGHNLGLGRQFSFAPGSKLARLPPIILVRRIDFDGCPPSLVDQKRRPILTPVTLAAILLFSFFFLGPERRRPMRLAGGEQPALPLALTPPRRPVRLPRHRRWPRAPFLFSLPSSFPEQWPLMAAGGDGGAATGPLAGARALLSGSAPPLSGLGVVPFARSPHAR